MSQKSLYYSYSSSPHPSHLPMAWHVSLDVVAAKRLLAKVLLHMTIFYMRKFINFYSTYVLFEYSFVSHMTFSASKRKRCVYSKTFPIDLAPVNCIFLSLIFNIFLYHIFLHERFQSEGISAVLCCVVKCSVLCSVVHCTAVWCSVVQCGAVWCIALQCGAVWLSLIHIWRCRRRG